MSGFVAPARSRAWVALAAVLVVAALLASALLTVRRGAEAPSARAADPLVEQLGWEPCGEGLEGSQCASLPVPLDHADPFGPQMRLAVMRLPATGAPDRRIGSLVLNPGGPGGSALDFLTAYAPRFSEEVRARFDVVAFNPRGVTGSSPAIECPTPEPPAPDPADWQGLFEGLQEPLAASSTACQLSIARTGPYFGTNQVVEDLELLRAAMGDQELNYWGISYGTRIGEVYAQRYPDRIRAMILDGNVDPHSTSLTFTSERGGSFDGAFELFLDVYPQVGPAFAQVAAALAEGPVEVLDSATGAPVSLTAQSFYTTTVMPVLPSEELWPVLAAEILAMATQLLGGPVANVLLVQGTANTATMGVQVNCLDLPQRPSVPVMTAAADLMVHEGPIFGQYVAATLPSCSGFAIPADPVPADQPLASALPPVLLLASLLDPATPYGWSTDMASFLPGSVRATYEGVQHGVWNGPSECIDAIGDAYVVELRLPDPAVSCPFVKPGSPEPGSGGS